MTEVIYQLCVPPLFLLSHVTVVDLSAQRRCVWYPNEFWRTVNWVQSLLRHSGVTCAFFLCLSRFLSVSLCRVRVSLSFFLSSLQLLVVSFIVWSAGVNLTRSWLWNIRGSLVVLMWHEGEEDQKRGLHWTKSFPHPSTFGESHSLWVSWLVRKDTFVFGLVFFLTRCWISLSFFSPRRLWWTSAQMRVISIEFWRTVNWV